MSYEILDKLLRHEKLVSSDITAFIKTIVQTDVPSSVIASFITAITLRGADLEEIKALVTAMRENAIELNFCNCDIVDSCGTGADLQGTFNISTSSAIVSAAAGAKVVKQTNSNITSRCGSSDFIDALGIKLCKNRSEAKEQFEKYNICFVHSPSFNKVARVLNPIRRELGFRSVFNFMGPMINPAFPNCQLLGVAFPEMARTMIEVLKFLNLKHAMVVNAKNPLLDEISIASETDVYELKNGEIITYTIKPEDFGIQRTDITALTGATPEYNANLVKDIFRGNFKGPKTDVIALNAGAMIYLSGLAKNLTEGIMKAYTAIDNGSALAKIEALKEKNDSEPFNIDF